MVVETAVKIDKYGREFKRIHGSECPETAPEGAKAGRKSRLPQNRTDAGEAKAIL